ncbi:Crp/Fnr family transcriptional regulator [Zhengella sp. ZM62]|uniref:Crp/Fnr family transcriptional regulator n=1 Tax=Zhengella sedimenti TaxID=3390035 RepID=UPI00397637E9
MDKKVRDDVHTTGVPALCQACEARHRGVCGALNTEQLVNLSKHSVRRKVTPGTELVGEEQDVSQYANVIGGVVKLTKMLSDGRQQIVGLQFAPDFLGRPFSRSSRFSAEAATEVELCSFSKGLIDRMIDQSPDLEHKLLEQTLKELDEARDWMLTLGRKTAAEKVASFLHLIAINVDPDAPTHDGPITFDLPLTRADIADFLGLTIETVSRQLTKLRKDGVIHIENNRHITVPDLERLDERASM